VNATSFAVRRLAALALAFAVCLATSASRGDVVIPPQETIVVASVEVDVSYEPDTALYTYAYRLTSEPGSIHEIWFFALEFPGTAVGGSAPQGWSYAKHTDRPIVSWAATEIGPLPPDFVDTGNIVPSPFNIKRGASLSGFSVQSPDPPGAAVFYADGFTPLPQVTGDVGELALEGDEILDFTERSFSGPTKGPVPLGAPRPVRPLDRAAESDPAAP
jgi:hypothetical protein